MNENAGDFVRQLVRAGLRCREAPSLHGAVEFEPVIRVYDRVSLTRVKIGAFTFVSYDTSIAHATIGRYCSIGHRCLINLGRHPTDRLSTHPFSYRDIFLDRQDYPDPLPFEEVRPVTIGHDVWLGAGVLVMGGVAIGNGAIIGAGSVVTKDVPPFSIAVGSPARVVRKRFSDELMAELEVLQWWRFDLNDAHYRGLISSWDRPAQAIADIRAAIEAGDLKTVPERTVKLQQRPSS